jgi:deoxyribodipyrimidine photo-lyase
MTLESEILERKSDLEKAEEKGDNDRVLDILKTMRTWTLTTALLSSTRLGLTVAGLKKSSHAEVAKLAGELVSDWKNLVRTASTAATPGSAVAAAPSPAQAIHEARQVQASAAAAAASTAAPASSTAVVPSAGFAGLKAALAAPVPTSGPGSGGISELIALYEKSSGFLEGDKIKCDSDRIEVLKKASSSSSSTGPIVLWLSRDQRILDNWAFVRAQQLAVSKKVPMVVALCLLPSYADASMRAYGFMLRGLKQLEADLVSLNIPFRLLLGQPKDQIPAFCNAIKASHLVADFTPLRVPMQWKKDVSKLLYDGCAFEQVDAHNIVPVWKASNKAEVGARTIRKKIHNAVEDYCTLFPKPVKIETTYNASEIESGFRVYDGSASPAAGGAGTEGSSSSSSSAVQVVVAPKRADNPSLTAWDVVLSHLRFDQSVTEVSWCIPGERAAAKAACDFIDKRLVAFDDQRNDPTKPNASSNLSPYLHFGHISAQRVVREVMTRCNRTLRGLFPEERTTGAHAFCEELVVRRELSDNFCYYTKDYDNLDGAANWARETLDKHASDKRTATYTRAQFEAGKTHEALWNAGQMELVHRGKLHG